MKQLFFLLLPFALLSCSDLDPKEDEPQTPAPKVAPEPEPEAPEAPPVEKPDDGLDFADPVTTGELVKPEDQKTVTGPAVTDVPTPQPDSAINVAPTAPTPAN